MSTNSYTQAIAGSGENVVWEGKSSQLLNLRHFILAFILLVAGSWCAVRFSGLLFLVSVAAAGYAFYKFLIINSATYTITSQRIIRRAGVFNRTTFEIELYRVKDVHLYEPIYYRPFGLGNISLISSQRSVPVFQLTAIKNAASVREQLRHLVEKRRNEKGVGEYDTN